MHDPILLVFTGILALSVLLQTIIFFRIYKSIQQMSQYLDHLGKDLLRNIESISSKVDDGLTTIKEMGEGLKPIKEKLAGAADIIHERITEVDAFLAETTDMARAEFIRIRERIEAASDKAEEILTMLHKSIMLPVHEIGAITRGFKAAIDALFRRRRNPSSASVQDDEMFI
jgi:hypothetical protein